MSTNKLKWHENNLKNVEAYLNGRKFELLQLQENIATIEKDVEFRKMQIASAKKEGRQEFDGTRYKRGK